MIYVVLYSSGLNHRGFKPQNAVSTIDGSTTTGYAGDR
jgi:hypothetical protein